MILEFVIYTDSAIERGIVSRSELPELLHFFKSAARRHFAKAFHLAGGLLIAERDDHFVTLSVSLTDYSIPSRCVFDSLEDAMARTFNITGVSESLKNSEEMGLPQWPYFD